MTIFINFCRSYCTFNYMVDVNLNSISCILYISHIHIHLFLLASHSRHMYALAYLLFYLCSWLKVIYLLEFSIDVLWSVSHMQIMVLWKLRLIWHWRRNKICGVAKPIICNAEVTRCSTTSILALKLDKFNVSGQQIHRWRQVSKRKEHERSFNDMNSTDLMNGNSMNVNKYSNDSINFKSCDASRAENTKEYLLKFLENLLAQKKTFWLSEHSRNFWLKRKPSSFQSTIV